MIDSSSLDGFIDLGNRRSDGSVGFAFEDVSSSSLDADLFSDEEVESLVATEVSESGSLRGRSRPEFGTNLTCEGDGGLSGGVLPLVEGEEGVHSTGTSEGRRG